MTLKELFERSNFNEIAPFIVKIYPEHKHMLPDYKMAFTVDTKSFTRKELEYLFNTDMITERKYRSHSYEVSQRIEYLKDLVANYESDNFSDYTRFILMFRTSSDYPLDQSESEALQNLFNQHLPASANVRYGYGYDEKLGTDVGILLLGSK